MAVACEAKIMVNAESTDVFEDGKYGSVTKTVTKSDQSKPPSDLFIVTPELKGTYPVILFCHGFKCSAPAYSDLFKHIASHGYIIVAPEFYNWYDLIPSLTVEVETAVKVSEWLYSGLPAVLPSQIISDTQNLVLAGHSRGGKTAFASAMGKMKSKRSKKNLKIANLKAVIGIDPVAGTSIGDRPAPKVLQYIPRSFTLSTPVAIIGSGYGNQWCNLVPPFAPDGVNHSEFFNESKPPATYFLAKDYGHCDILNDDQIYWSSFVCKGGKNPNLMRRGTAGIVVAFLRCYVGGKADDLNVIVDDPTVAPITLDPVIYVKE